MARTFGFLRALNVGGHTVPMARLKELFEELELGSVETFLASGNVTFDAGKAEPARLQRRIEAHLHQALGYEVHTFLRSELELASLVQGCPFSEAEVKAATALNVILLQAPLRPEAEARLRTLSVGVDRLQAAGREVWWLHAVKQVNGTIICANIHLLFWLSLVPFTTAWMGDNHFAALPVAVYGVVLFGAGTAYFLLTRSLVHHHGQASLLHSAVGTDLKTKVSTAIVLVAIPLAFLNRWVAFGLYWVVTLSWLVPDRRIERLVGDAEGEPSA